MIGIQFFFFFFYFFFYETAARKDGTIFVAGGRVGTLFDNSNNNRREDHTVFTAGGRVLHIKGGGTVLTHVNADDDNSNNNIHEA